MTTMLKHKDHPLAGYYTLFGSAAMLTALGIVMVLSASFVRSLEQSGSVFSIFLKQILMLFLALPVAYAATRMNPKRLREFAPALLFLAIVLEMLVLVPGLRVSINGNANWIGIGGFTIQPSEPAKLAMVIFLAHVFARHDLRTLPLSRLVMYLGISAVPIIGLVLVGHDLGTAMVMMAIVFAMLFFAGLPGRWLAMAVVPAIPLLAFLIFLKGSRVSRIMAAYDPFSDANYLDAGWQPAHGIMAMATGGIFGVGLGGSRQKWQNLGPEAHTDFIFAVIGEELGLLGSLVTLALFLALAWAAIRTAIKTTDIFSRLMVAGITSWIIIQATINIGSVINLFPVVGVPLPLVSYGGSALGTTLVAVGFLLGVARREPGVKQALGHAMSTSLAQLRSRVRSR